MEAVWFVVGALVGGLAVAGVFLRSQSSLREERGGLQAALDAERNATKEKLDTLTQARDDLLAVVKESAGQALSERGEQIVGRLKAELEAAKTDAGADLERRQKAVEDLVAPVTTALTEMGKSLKSIDEDRRRTHTELSTRLKDVTDAQREVRAEAGAIGRALRQPHTRGRWGELHLRRLAEVTGMSDMCDFTEQMTVDGEEGPLRPDMIVHLPGGKEVVVDAKAPLGPYLEACEATEPAARDAHMKLYARGLRAHVRKLAAKEYAAQFDSAPDFVVMYVPGEHFFSAAVEVDPELIEAAASQNVVIGTPTTLIVLLKTIAHAWQQERVAEEAQAIATLGSQLHARLKTYLEHVNVVSKRLNSLVAAQNDAVGSLERRVLPSARRFPDLGAVAADAKLPPPRTVDANARELQVEELPRAVEETDLDAADGREAA
jgi:DNA recombination protein RmuC